MLVSHAAAFEQLCNERDVIVVSGAQESQMRDQLPEKEAMGRYYLLTQNGNHALAKDGTVLWVEHFAPQQETAITSFIAKLHDELDLPVRDEHDLVEHRGSQISYSLIGHHEDHDKKGAFDPDHAKRLHILQQHAGDVEDLKIAGVDVRSAGTTCFDFYPLGKHKGYNIERFIKYMGWNKEDCMYIGDALFPGGNDETVIGVIPTHAVKDQDETSDFIKNALLSS